MKKSLTVAVAALLGAAAIAGSIQPEPASNPAGKLGKEIVDAKMARMQGGMAAWMESMQPGKPHEMLSKLVGDWEVRTQMFMGRDADPMETIFQSSAEMTMGGRYLEQRGKGSFMGMSMDSLLVLGYDNVRQLFHATMFDSTGTGVRTLYGNLDETGRVLTFVGPMDEPMTGEIGKSFRVVMTFESADRYSYTIDEILYGEPFTVVRAVAIRRVE